MKKYLTIAVALLLLSLYLPISSANIAVHGSTGLHVFDLEKRSSTYTSHGSFVIENLNDDKCYITLSIITKLRPTDLDNGTPRIHDIYRGDITFYELDNPDWIILNDTKKVIPPHEVAVFNYTVSIDPNELDKDQDNKSGYMSYIKIRGDSDEAVGMNYIHNVFICFDGKYSTFTLNPFIIFILSILIALISTYLFLAYKKRKNKMLYQE